MRVAFDISAMRGRKTGIGAYSEQLLNALHEHAPQVETVALEDDASENQRTDKRIWREQFLLPRLAQNANADLLHLTGFAAPLRSRVPVILTVMDLIGVLFPNNFPPASRFYWSRYLPFTLRGARHLITLSEHTKRDVIQLAKIPPARISVIACGFDSRYRVINDKSLLESAGARLKLPDRYFLFISTLEPRKGIDTLVSAFAEIAARVPEQLVLVGKRGWYYETLFAQVRAMNLESRLRFMDYLDDADLPIVYNLATAFVFPSRYEGFGLPPLEAMACGVPVISSNASSLPKVVGDAGILLPPDDVTGLANAMLNLSHDESRRAHLRQLGLARAAQFSWQRGAIETAALYERISNRRSSFSLS